MAILSADNVPNKECRLHFSSRHTFCIERTNEIRKTQWDLAECIDKGHNFIPRNDAPIGHETCTRCGYNRR
ncbi:MAG: hypothetical protein KAS32_13295 [Candidatus Peribacteraceae bacterium]|nr:hypothetical protein [Candidatus Peribacteraceae bacterium]